MLLFSLFWEIFQKMLTKCKNPSIILVAIKKCEKMNRYIDVSYARRDYDGTTKKKMVKS